MTIPSTHLSEMGQEGNALYSFTKTHFISKNSINTLEDTEKEIDSHYLIAVHRIHSIRCQKIKTVDQIKED